MLGKAPIISGERDHHQGCLKLSQTSLSIDAVHNVIAHAGIGLLLPIRHIDNSSQIEEIVGKDWEQGQRQLKCVFSGNYYDLEKEVIYDAAPHKRYLDEFLVPCGKAIIDAWLAGGTEERVVSTRIDYNAIVKDVLKEVSGVIYG